MSKKKLLDNTVTPVRAPSGAGTILVQAYGTEANPLPSSAFRQPLTGPKVHGGHCAGCGAELESHSMESYRGKCDTCKGKEIVPEIIEPKVVQ